MWAQIYSKCVYNREETSLKQPKIFISASRQEIPHKNLKLPGKVTKPGVWHPGGEGATQAGRGWGVGGRARVAT